MSESFGKYPQCEECPSQYNGDHCSVVRFAHEYLKDIEKYGITDARKDIATRFFLCGLEDTIENRPHSFISSLLGKECPIPIEQGAGLPDKYEKMVVTAKAIRKAASATLNK